MIIKTSRKALGAVCRVPGGLRLARRLQSRAVAVVMYHGVTAVPMPVPNWCQIDVVEFERQVEFLSRQYRILPLREVVERLADGKSLPARTACLTFDDGFRNVLTTACPVLRRFQTPATVFLVTGAIGTRQPAWPDLLSRGLALTPLPRVAFDGETFSLSTVRERASAASRIASRLKAMDNDQRERRFEEMRDLIRWTPVADNEPQATLNWDEIHQLSREGLIEFGAHTHSHPILSRCSLARQEEELRASRDALTKHLGRADLFAYPNGAPDDYNDDTMALLRDLGYRCAVTTCPGVNRPGQDRFQIRRIGIGNDTTGAQFELRMVGL